jgi:hypothetical protein
VSEPIKVGDLVVIAKPTLCCNDSRNVGRIFTVRAIGRAPANWCAGCFATFPMDDVCAQLAEWRENYAVGGWLLLSRLKRIDPLSELDDVKQDEEITA